MIQDLSFGKLEIEFYNALPSDSDIVYCFNGDSVLICTGDDGALSLPRFCQVKEWGTSNFRYIFTFQEVKCFLFMGEAGDCPDTAYNYEKVRPLRQLQSKDVCFGVMTAWHLFIWYKNNRFCGRCGSETVHDDAERMLRCKKCGNMIFPRISPAVIIAVTDGDRLLLSKYAGREYTRFALLAGYTEIGETLEETVQREVMEEVGLKVKNIRYYKSQPWGVDGNVLMGFYCDLDGDGTIILDQKELSMAQWFERGNIPAKDDGFSLTREMIRVFEEGKEPKQ